MTYHNHKGTVRGHTLEKIPLIRSIAGWLFIGGDGFTTFTGKFSSSCYWSWRCPRLWVCTMISFPKEYVITLPGNYSIHFGIAVLFLVHITQASKVCSCVQTLVFTFSIKWPQWIYLFNHDRKMVPPPISFNKDPIKKPIAFSKGKKRVVSMSVICSGLWLRSPFQRQHR